MPGAIEQAIKSGSSSVTVIEDEPEILEALDDFLSAQGFSVRCFPAAEEALEELTREPSTLVISDMKLPGMDGIELCKCVKEAHPETSIIVITAFGNVSSALIAIDFGAEDYILKPFNLETLRNSIERVFERRILEEENRRYLAHLEDEVRARTRQVRNASRKIGETFYKIIHVLGNAQECREPFLRGRTERVTITCLRTVELLDFEQEIVGQILLGAPISDVGKLAVPDTILNKPASLNEAEMAIVREHVEAGERIVSSLAHFRDVAPVIRLHHERHDGGGYPEGLSGEDIPPAAALVGIADSFDAMTHPRPWRAAKSYDEAIGELRALAGSAYNEDYIKAFALAAERFDFRSLIGSKPSDLFYQLTFPLLERLEHTYSNR